MSICQFLTDIKAELYSVGTQRNFILRFSAQRRLDLDLNLPFSEHSSRGIDSKLVPFARWRANRQRRRICSLGKHPTWSVGFTTAEVRGTTVWVELSSYAVGKCLKALRTHWNQRTCARMRHQMCCTLAMIVAVFSLNLWCYHCLANAVVLFATEKHAATCTYYDAPPHPPSPSPFPSFPHGRFTALPCLCQTSAPVFLSPFSSGNCRTFCVLTGVMRLLAWKQARRWHV